jgi:hypothetical protein
MLVRREQRAAFLLAKAQETRMRSTLGLGLSVICGIVLLGCSAWSGAWASPITVTATGIVLSDTSQMFNGDPYTITQVFDSSNASDANNIYSFSDGAATSTVTIGGNVFAIFNNASNAVAPSEPSAQITLAPNFFDSSIANISPAGTIRSTIEILSSNAFVPSTSLSQSLTYSPVPSDTVQAGILMYSEPDCGAPCTTRDITVDVMKLTYNASPSPTLRQLAQASGDIYSGNSAPTADGVSPAYTFVSDNCLLGCLAGSRAAAYISPDGTQIIVSIRGTNFGSGDYAIAALKDLLADGSFVTNTATPGLEQETAAAAAFLRHIESQYPNATITLTGHSLGGAIAQALAEYSGLTADTFNAPGIGGALYDQLVPYMLPVEGRTAGSITNYRIYGDQYSLFGSPLPGVTTITLPSVVSDSVIAANPSEYIQTNHSISTVFTQITGYENGTVVPDASAGPNITAQIEANYIKMATEIISTTPTDAMVIVAGFTYVVTLGETFFFDPDGGTDFTFTEAQGSPNFACINLPAVTGVGSYDVRWEIGNSWSSFQNLLTGGQTCFDPGTDGVEFLPLDLSGQGRI